MAESKTAKKPKAAKASKTAKASSNGRSSAKASGSKAKTGGSRAKSANRSKSNGSRSTKRSAPAATAAAVKSLPETAADGLSSARDTAGELGHRAGKVASKAKVPLIAGGAALAGAASGIALNAARNHNGKTLGVRMPKTKVKIRSKDLAKAADRVAVAGEQIGKLSTGIRELQGTKNGSDGNGHHRSPIEVVIQGLTRRHRRSVAPAG